MNVDALAHPVRSAPARAGDHATDPGRSCPACGGRRVETFYRVEGVPASSCLLFDSAEAAAACPVGDIELGFCRDCGFIHNQAFNLALTEYSGRYEETQAFSPTFNAFHEALARRLIGRYGLAGRSVLEIGCGKGEFLLLLAQLGKVRGVGVDPGVRVDRLDLPADLDVRFIADFYSPRHTGQKVDLVVCKMTLEHIPNALEFMRTVRESLGEQTGTDVFFQIPEALRILRECSFEDIYYEHCAYFSPGALARLFRRAGFDVLALGREYGDQYLTIEARPSAGGETAPLADEDDMAELDELVASFPERIGRMRQDWIDRVERARSAGRSVVLWGSGSKAVSFLTTLGLGDRVDYVTDINPRRHGHFMPVTGQRIVPPAELGAIKPDLVIVMNRIYRDEIAADLARMGLSPEIACL
jgi:SAM-dependent methyltransferase